jgi:hypothetical protein
MGKIAFVAPKEFILRRQLHRFRGVVVGDNVWISQFVYIDELHPADVNHRPRLHQRSSNFCFRSFLLGIQKTGESRGKL